MEEVEDAMDGEIEAETADTPESEVGEKPETDETATVRSDDKEVESEIESPVGEEVEEPASAEPAIAEKAAADIKDSYLSLHPEVADHAAVYLATSVKGVHFP